MVVNVDQHFVVGTARSSEYVTKCKGDQVKRPLRQTVAAERQQLGIEKLAVYPLNPAGLAANVPRSANVTGPVLELHFYPVSRFELARRLTHDSPHLASNSASLRSISSLVRMFFSIRIVSILAIQRS